MDNLFCKNETFLRNIYSRGPFRGNAFVCHPEIGLPRVRDYTVSDRPIEEWIPRLVCQYEASVKFSSVVGDDHVPYVPLMTGTHIYAAAFGCRVYEPPDDNPGIIPLVKNSADADRIDEPDIWSSRSLSRVFDLGHAVQKEFGRDVFLGPCDVQSGFDTAALIWNKTDFYAAMMTEPDAVKRLAGKCARLLKKFLIELRREFPRLIPCHCPQAWAPPERAPWLSNDECGAMNTASFEEFCLPELIDLSKAFGGLGMHCCANAEHQFESFKKIPDFYAFNRVSGKNGYLPLLEHFNEPSPPVFVLSWLPDETVEQLIENAPATVRFIFVKTDVEKDEAKRWLEHMRLVSKNAISRSHHTISV